MKKCVFLVVFVLMLVLPFTAFATAEQKTSLDTGDRNVAFSNGYRGFCLDVNLKGAYAGDVFTPADDTSAATSNQGEGDISHWLKILFTQCFEDVFVSDGNGGYQIADTNLVQAIVWHFSDGQYVWGEQSRLVNLVKAYTGPTIPDDGYVKELDNGDTITFHFTVMTPRNPDQQYFFAYKIAVNEEPTHEHEWPNEWTTDEDGHWHECECGEKKDEGDHSGGEASCDEQATCETCGEPYGEEAPLNHTGDTEIRNDKPAQEFEPGYTGDTHCKDCGEKLHDGQDIPPTHEHEWPNEWTTDEDCHWHECECGEKKDEGEHIYKDGNCSICGEDDPDSVVEAPKTSDDFKLGLWSAILLLSMSSLILMTIIKRNSSRV